MKPSYGFIVLSYCNIMFTVNAFWWILLFFFFLDVLWMDSWSELYLLFEKWVNKIQKNIKPMSSYILLKLMSRVLLVPWQALLIIKVSKKALEEVLISVFCFAICKQFWFLFVLRVFVGISTIKQLSIIKKVPSF